MRGRQKLKWLLKTAGLLLAALLPLAALAAQAPQTAAKNAPTPAAAQQTATNPPAQAPPTAPPPNSIGQIVHQAVQQAIQQTAQQIQAQAGTGNPNQLTPEQQYELEREGNEIAREAVRQGGGRQGTLALLVPFGFFATIILIVWLVSRRRQAQFRAQTELRKQLIDKFGSAQELAAFLESKGGQQFFQDMRPAPSSRSPRFLALGIVFTTVGLAFLGLGIIKHQDFSPGVLFLSVGVGLLLSVAIGHKLTPRQGADAGTRGGDAGTGMAQLPRA